MILAAVTPTELEDSIAKYKQLTSDDRLSIENGLRNKDSFKKIGETMGKDCTTISKEICSHLIFKNQELMADHLMTA